MLSFKSKLRYIFLKKKPHDTKPPKTYMKLIIS